MKKLSFFTTALLIIFFATKTNAQNISDAGVLGIGLQASNLNYGLSGKYNFTEIHTGQLIIGGANYGFGTSGFTVTGRYLYNFNDSGNLRPYVGGQAGFWTVKVDFGPFLGGSDSFTAITYGVFGGLEYAFDGLEKLGFSAEIGYTGGSFGNGLSSITDVTISGGIHYYFDF